MFDPLQEWTGGPVFFIGVALAVAFGIWLWGRGSRRAAQALSDAYATTIAQLSDAVIVLDAAGCCTSLNPAAQRLIGVTAAEHKTLSQIWPDAPALLAQSLDAGEVHTELVLDGGSAPRTFELHVAPGANPRQASPHRVIRLHEITAAVHCRQALETSENRHQTTLQIAGRLRDGLAIAGAQRVLYANDRALEIFGHPAHALTLDRFADVVAAEDRERVRQVLDRVRQPAATAEAAEFWIVQPGGLRRYVGAHFSALPQRFSVDSCLIVATDLTDQKQAEETVRDRETRLRLLIGHMPAVVWSTDTRLQVNFVLGEGLAGLGGDSTQIISQMLSSEPAAIGKPSFADMHRRVLQGDSLAFETEWQARWLQVRLEPLRSPEGTRAGVIGLALDITERKRTEDAEYEQRTLAQALRDSAAALNSTLNVDEVLDRILENVGHVVPHDAACIQLIDKDQAHVARYRGYGKYGITDRDMLALPLPLDRLSDLSELLEKHNPIVISDTRLMSSRATIPQLQWRRSGVMAPIVNDGRLIGVLILDSEQPDFYSWADASRLLIFADQAAVALRNAHLLAGAQLRTEQLERVHEAGLALNRVLDPRTQLEILFKITAQAFHVERVAFFRYDPERNQVRYYLSIGDSPQTQAILRQVKFSADDDGVMGLVVRQRRPLNIPDLYDDPRFNRIEPDLRSGVWVPVEHEGKLLGILSVLSVQAHAFTADDERLLMLFAHQAAVALENARHFEETQQRAQRQELLYHLSTSIAHVQEAELLCDTVARELQRTLRYPHLQIYLVDPETGDRVLEAQVGLPETALPTRWHPGEGLTDKAAQTGELQYWPNVALEQPDRLNLPGMYSELDVPIKMDNTVLGVLAVEDPRPDAFAAGDFDVLQAVANQLAMALENTRLFEEISRRAEELQVLNAAALQIAQHSDSTEIIQTACNELVRFGTFASVFLLADGELTLAHAALNAEMQRDYTATFGENPQPVVILPSRIPDVWSRLQAGRTIVQSNLTSQMAAIVSPESRPIAEWLQARLKQRSLLLAPLTRLDSAAEQKTIGLIAISGQRLGAPETTAIALVARHISVALENARLIHEAEQRARVFAALFETSRDLATENARLLEETDQRARVFAALFEISRDLATRRDRLALLQNIVQCTTALLGAHGAAIYLFNAVRNDLELAVSEGAPSLPAGMRLNLGEDVAGRVARMHQPIIVDDYDAWEHRSPRYDHHALTHVMGIPMLWAGELIGVLAVYGVGSTGRRFTEADEHLLTLFAGPAANVVRNAHLLAETERRIRELSTLNRIASSINSTLEFERVLELTMQEVQELFQVEVCSLMLLDEQTQELVVQTSRGIAPEQDHPIRVGPNQGIAGLVAQQGQALLVPDVRADPRWFPGVDLRTGFTTRSIIAVPLRNRGRTVGVMEVINKLEGLFNEDDLQMLESISMTVTAAIENARLFGELNKAYQELAQTSRQIMESRNTLRALFDGITDSICILDQDYHIVAINQAAASEAGGIPPTLVGSKCYSVFCQRNEPCVDCPMVETLQTGRTCLRTTKRVGAQGATRELELRTFPLESASGLADRVVYIASDVTEKHQMQLSLLQSAKLSAVGELAAGVAHEIRNPLTAVIGNAQMLQRSLQPDTPHHEMARLIEHASLRAERVVRNLLNFSRREEYVFGPTDLNATIEDAYSLIAYAMERSKIRVTRKLADNLPTIIASPSHLQTVWTNLLLNARDAIPGQHGQIRIETRYDKRNRQVRVLFKDNGQGIPEKDVARIFEPFFTTKAPSKGTGLGLYISYTVIAQHHGTISVQSEVGQGTAFTILLPLEAQSDSEETAA